MKISSQRAKEGRGVWSRRLSSSVSCSNCKEAADYDPQDVNNNEKTNKDRVRIIQTTEVLWNGHDALLRLTYRSFLSWFSLITLSGKRYQWIINKCFTVASTVSTHILLSAWTSKAGFSLVDNSPGLLALRVFLQHLKVPKIKEHDRFWHFSVLQFNLSVICKRFNNRCNIRTYQTYLVSLRTIKTDGTLRKKLLLLNLMIKKRFIFSNNCFADFFFTSLV